MFRSIQAVRMERLAQLTGIHRVIWPPHMWQSVQRRKKRRACNRLQKFGEIRRPRGDNAGIMATIHRNCVPEEPLVSDIRNLSLSSGAIILGIVLTSTASRAQWWQPRAPIDFEECAEHADKAGPSKEQRASLLSECDAKFAGRRKPGGGYTYFDFMQDRRFDIAGPNPTPQELKEIDEQYKTFLDHQRRSVIAATFAEKKNQQAQVELAEEQRPASSGAKIPLPVRRPPVRAKAVNCQDQPLTCGWSQLAAKVQSIKKSLLGPTAKKVNRG
jgi:hypothetical protein